jgi:hypothetical protein
VTRLLPGLRMRFAVGLAVPALIAVTIVYFTLALYPASISTSAVREVRYQRVRLEADRMEKGEIKDPDVFVKREILDRLKSAKDEDATNVVVLAQLAEYTMARWQSVQLLDVEGRKKIADEANKFAADAQRANPEGEDGYLSEYKIRVAAGQRLNRVAKQLEDDLEADAKKDAKKKTPGKSDKDKADKDKKQPERKMSPQERVAWARRAVRWRNEAVAQHAKAAEALQPYLSRDPHDPNLRFLLAHAFDKAGKKIEAEEAARAALEIDAKVGDGRPRSLSDQQRDRLRQILGKQSAP